MVLDNDDLIDQQLIHNNKEIFARIEKELSGATSEILVAAAWFTDNDLLNLLLKKVGDGVKVEVIIAANKENEKLDFQQLILKGASVLKIKNVGYGMMHQKFCVIDRKIALHGSFNWSVNAKKNNHESIIATNHKGTINSLVENFLDIKQKAFELESAPEKNKLKTLFNSVFVKKKQLPMDIESKPADQEKYSQSDISIEKVLPDSRTEYEKVLDSMIAAEVSNFDRTLLRNQGYDRAKANNGDHQVLTKSLDSVYSVFINEINVVEDKKNRLISKVEEQKVKTTAALKESLELQSQTIESECEFTKENVGNKITHLLSQISLNEKEIEGIKKIKIPDIEDKNIAINDKIKIAEREFVKPALKLFELIPLTILLVGLLVYIVMFYSSASYILLFSEQDATMADMAGEMIEPAEVFNPHAISRAIEKGWVATLFIFVFVFLPLAFALAGRFTDKWKSIAGMVLVDVAIAYKVAESVHRVNRLSGTVATEWDVLMVFQDVNFYLVFILGAAGLFFFSYAFNKFISYFEERNPDLNSIKNQVYMNQLREETSINNSIISGMKEEIEGHEKSNIQHRSEIIICETELEALPKKRVNLIEKKKAEFALKVQNIDIVTDIYKSHIENDNLPISVDSMKDRLNVFLEGWNDFLHDEYAVVKAVEKSKLANLAITEWQNLKFETNSVDRRIKA